MDTSSVFGELDQRQQLIHRFSDLLALVFANAQAVTDVLLDCHLWKQRVRLKDDAHAAFTRR